MYFTTKISNASEYIDLFNILQGHLISAVLTLETEERIADLCRLGYGNASTTSDVEFICRMIIIQFTIHCVAMHFKQTDVIVFGQG
jgi:hypothetical protein